MTIEELSRTNVQALWRHMPDQPFNWGSKASVIGETPRQVSPLDVPEPWVVPALRRLIGPFAEASSGVPGQGPELDVLDRGTFELVKAEELRASRFPNTFLCRACGRFTTVKVGQGAPACPTHGPMRQFPFAAMHECGHMEELRAPACASGCGAPMGLFNTSAFETSSWYWRCSACKTKVARPVSGVWCSSCRTGRVMVARVPQTIAYYPQSVTILNPPTRTVYASIAQDEVHAAAIAQALDVLPPGLAGLRVAGGLSTDVVVQFEQMAATLGWTAGNPLYDAGLADAKAKAGTAPPWRDKVADLGLDDAATIAFGDECLQLSLARDAAAMTVDDLRAEAAGTSLADQYDQLPGLFDRYGLLDVTLLRQLPVAYVVAGYTRLQAKAVTAGTNGPRVARFRFFAPGKGGKFRMYGVRTETEGLLFQLDRLAIVRWLVDSGVVADPGVSTQAQAQAWLLSTMEPVTDLFAPPTNPVSAAVLGLVHSIAHRAMKAFATRSGLNVDSLAEYLFPANGAFLLYANTRSEFILGGLEHVFRHDMVDALGELDAEQRCVFDPPCRHAFGGACAACLHVSEVACARFNTVLDRNLLFGTIPQPGDPAPPVAGRPRYRGYWSPPTP
ncbi:hypothetical protein [Cellulomonas hominis]